MAILVSGGAGYIGSHTCVELLAAGYDIVVADNYYNSCPEALARVKKIAGKDFRFVEADMTDKDAVEKIFAENEDIDCVIQFAAYKAVGESVSKPIEYYSNNLACTFWMSCAATTATTSSSPPPPRSTATPPACPSARISPSAAPRTPTVPRRCSPSAS